MANVGVQIYNTGNTLIIDGEYRNAQLLGVFDVVCSSQLYAGTFQGTLNIPAVDVMAGIRCVNPAAIFTTSESSGSTTLTIVSKTQNAAVKVFVFGYPVISPGRSGLQVWDASGKLVFDSNQKYMRLESMVNVTFPNDSTPYPIAMPSGKECVAIVSQPFSAYFVSSSGIPPSNWQVARNSQIWMNSVNGNVITFARQQLFAEVFISNSPANLTQVRLSGQIMLVNVTNFI